MHILIGLLASLTFGPTILANIGKVINPNDLVVAGGALLKAFADIIIALLPSGAAESFADWCAWLETAPVTQLFTCVTYLLNQVTDATVIWELVTMSIVMWPVWYAVRLCKWLYNQVWGSA